MYEQVDGEMSTDFATALTEYMRAKGASVKGWILLGKYIENESNEISKWFGGRRSRNVFLVQKFTSREKTLTPVEFFFLCFYLKDDWISIFKIRISKVVINI